jgi:GTP cyclohydrolase I
MRWGCDVKFDRNILVVDNEIRKGLRIELAIKDVLMALEIDLSDPNFTDTPGRVAKAMLEEWFKGYQMNPKDVLTVFPNNGHERDLVVVKDIPLYSTCAHHMSPFIGKAAIAYLPGTYVIGLSKLARVVDIFARRLQLQEQITWQVADCLMSVLEPQGVIVTLYDVMHTCMTSRGVHAHESSTTTSASRGIFLTDAALRAEAITHMRSGK